jgi:hypothetical protein
MRWKSSRWGHDRVPPGAQPPAGGAEPRPPISLSEAEEEEKREDSAPRRSRDAVRREEPRTGVAENVGGRRVPSDSKETTDRGVRRDEDGRSEHGYEHDGHTERGAQREGTARGRRQWDGAIRSKMLADRVSVAIVINDDGSERSNGQIHVEGRLGLELTDDS